MLGRFASAGAIWVALGLSSGCATYAKDLERAQRHYEANEFARALAVLRLLGEDEAALGEAEQVRYAYLRGMTDYRLSSLTTDHTQTAFRSCARDWLGLALEGAKQYGRALSEGERTRARQALADVSATPGSGGACLTAGER